MSAEITVLMPVRNAEAHIGAAIASLLMQTEVNFVLMLLDDGSTDGSIAIAESIPDRRIGIVRDARQLGLAARLNQGLDLTNTPFVARMDADDLAVRERLARQLAFMRGNPEVAICGTWYRAFAETPSGPRPCWDGTPPTGHLTISAGAVFSSPIAHPTVMLNVRLLREAGLRYDEMAEPAEDYDLWERAASVVTLANVPEILLLYRIHAEQGRTRSADAQAKRSDAIRERALARRGIRPSPAQLRAHNDYSRAERFSRRIDKRYRDLRWLRWLRENAPRRDANDFALIHECQRRETLVRAEIRGWWRRRLSRG